MTCTGRSFEWGLRLGWPHSSFGTRAAFMCNRSVSFNDPSSRLTASPVLLFLLGLLCCCAAGCSKSPPPAEFDRSVLATVPHPHHPSPLWRKRRPLLVNQQMRLRLKPVKSRTRLRESLVSQPGSIKAILQSSLWVTSTEMVRKTWRWLRR